MNPGIISRIFSSRKVWIGLTAIAAVALAKLGLSDEQAKPITDAITIIAGVVIAGMAYEDGSEKRNPQSYGPPLPAEQSTSTRVLPLVLLGALSFCTTGCSTAPAPYVAADRSTYESVGAEWINYVRHDATLAPDQIARRETKYRTWGMRLDAAGKTDKAISPVPATAASR